MGVIEFFENLPDDGSAPPYSALAELSGISSAEVGELAQEWEDWPPERLRDLLTRLAAMTEDDVRLEFEAVFKAGLHAADPDVRLLSINGLAGSMDRTIIARLVDILERDSDERVRVAAATSMASFCTLGAEGKLHDRDVTRLYKSLAGVLGDPSTCVAVRRRALEAIAVFPGRAVDALIEWAYRASDPLLLQSALYAMGRSSSPRWLRHVVAELDSPHAPVRYEAATALGELGEEEEVGHLRPMLDDHDLEVQMAAVRALGRIGGGAARSLLVRASRSSEPLVAETAAASLEILDAENALTDVVPASAEDGASMFGTTEELELIENERQLIEGDEVDEWLADRLDDDDWDIGPGGGRQPDGSWRDEDTDEIW